MIRKLLPLLLVALLLLCPYRTAHAFTPTPSPTPDAEGNTAAPSTPDPAHAPTITLLGEQDMVVNAAFTFEDHGATAVDYRGNDMTGRMVVSGEVIPYLVGEYSLSYSVMDDRGNTATARRTVTVVPVELPEIVQPPEKTIYLTFDDGPSNHTALLLDILKKYNVKATFFVVGNRTRTDMIRRAFEEGHSIGVHSYTHDMKKIYASEEAFFADFQATQEVIFAATGQYTTIFRFPGGGGNDVSYFNKGIMTRLTKIMEDMGYRYFDWTTNARDSNSTNYKASHYNGTLMRNTNTDGSPTVTLQHDLNVNSVRALDYYIPWALQNGYTFLPLDMTSPVIHTEVRN